MPEGLSPGEVGKEISEHRAHALEEAEKEGHAPEAKGRDRWIVVIEAVLLAVVAVLAAWSGFASARWGTTSSLDLAKASTNRAEANRAQLSGLSTTAFDAITFNAWFTAYLLGDQQGEVVAERRFRPQYRVAFESWLATDPFTNASAPAGPTYMRDYVHPGAAAAAQYDKVANALYASGQTAGDNSDGYVR